MDGAIIFFFDSGKNHMKYWIIALTLIFIPFSGHSQDAVIIVKNPAEFDRPLETVGIPWSDLKAYFSPSQAEQLAVYDGGTRLTVQWFKTGDDDAPGSLLFQSSFKNGEERRFSLRSAEPEPSAASIAEAKYVLPRKDVAWENDRIAFRIYGGPIAGKVRDGIDVWVKRVRYNIIDKWYDGDSLKGKKRISYHVDHGEGADYFEVGQSLGAGGTALWNGGSLLQAGLFAGYSIIASGPIRTSFQVTYDTVFEGRHVMIEKSFTLDAGENLNRIDVRYSGIPGDQPPGIAAGLVKRKNVAAYFDDKSVWLSLWGPTDDDSTHGFIGTGVVIPPASFKEFREDSIHQFAIGTITPEIPLTYFAGACWTRSGDFTDKDDWNRYLARFAQRVSHPLDVMIQKSDK